MRGVRFVIHYLDDFLFIGPPASSECAYALATFINLCETLGIPLSPQKVIGPVTCLDFLGIELDSVAMEARLPASKLQHLQSTVNTWLGCKSCQKRELLSLIGELQHASSVVRSGRTFLQRMICLSTAAKELYHHIRLNKEFRSDLTWWATFLQSWNGTNMMRAINRESPEITLTSDASGSWGCGAFWHDQWFHINWHPAWESMDITVKELLPIVVGAAVWGSHWAHRTVLCLCDNAAVVAIINTGRSKNEPAMHLLRCLLFIAAHHEFDIFARHLPGACNSAADALSRDRLPLFFSTVPQASPHRSRFVDYVRTALQQAGIDSAVYSGHSFRIGAATTAASHGLEDSLIQTLGRWESDAYRRYIHIPRAQLASVSCVLAKQ